MLLDSEVIPPSPFVGVTAPAPPSLLDRLLRRQQSEKAEQAIGALLATRSPHQVSESQIAELLQRYRCVGQAARGVAGRLWTRAIKSFAADKHLSDEEVAYLDRLCRLLDIGFDDVERFKGEILHPIFKAETEGTVLDGVVTAEETAFLERLQASLRLPPDVAIELRKQSAKNTVLTHLAAVVADRRVSPDELNSLDVLAKNLRVDVTLEDNLRQQLSRFAALWRIENGDLPVIEAGINLQKGETCHYKSDCTWHEMRRHTTRINYHGPVASIRIAKGLRYRLGSIAPQRMTTDELTEIDSGTVYFTNKRVLFDGQLKNTSIRLSALIGIEVYENALVLEKATGRSPHLELHDDVEYASVIVSTLLARG